MSSTIGLIHKIKQRRAKKSKAPALKFCPQHRGIVKKSFIVTPRKPNSAKRKVAKVLICRTRRVVDIYLEGILLNRLNPHSVVLVRGRGPRDLPGVNYHAIRGKGDFPPLLNRKKGRSKYGAKQIKDPNAKPLFQFKRIVDKHHRATRYRYLIYGHRLNEKPNSYRYNLILLSQVFIFSGNSSMVRTVISKIINVSSSLTSHGLLHV